MPEANCPEREELRVFEANLPKRGTLRWPKVMF